MSLTERLPSWPHTYFRILNVDLGYSRSYKNLDGILGKQHFGWRFVTSWFLEKIAKVFDFL